MLKRAASRETVIEPERVAKLIRAMTVEST